MRRVPDWETLLAHAARLQTQVPGAVLVGGTAAAIHARHRYSVDHDHVLPDLPRHFDAALRALESTVGWKTRRRIRGKLVLGEVDQIGAGLRNHHRAAPLETIEVEIADGHRLRLPTIEEMLRIKAFLVVDRNATRDYLDVAALSYGLGLSRSTLALERLGELYADFVGESGGILTSLLVHLSDPAPFDLTDVDLTEYKGIVPPWNDWRAVRDQCADLAVALLADPPAR